MKNPDQVYDMEDAYGPCLETLARDFLSGGGFSQNDLTDLLTTVHINAEAKQRERIAELEAKVADLQDDVWKADDALEKWMTLLAERIEEARVEEREWCALHLEALSDKAPRGRAAGFYAAAEAIRKKD